MTAINRPLTDEERHLMNLMAIAVVGHQTRCTSDEAAQVLDKLAGEGDVILKSDAEDARLVVSGKAIVHAKRDWLAFHAEHPEAIDMRHITVERHPDDDQEDNE